MIPALAILLLASQASQQPPKHRLLTADDLHSFTWRSIGPANMGGRASDLAFAPNNGKTYFAAFGTGGLFRTTSMGTAFQPVFD
ncbi:MAG TPA: hypothetical protein VKT78_10930, partial [Fimbriimonadaceae bacterium]|nr:hypothetical protein [Fimbriimonadaceae bacterium]